VQHGIVTLVLYGCATWYRDTCIVWLCNMVSWHVYCMVVQHGIVTLVLYGCATWYCDTCIVWLCNMVLWHLYCMAVQHGISYKGINKNHECLKMVL